MIIFPDFPHVKVEGVEVAEEITLTLRTTSLTASCPSCGTTSSRIQSRYTRTLRDLPTGGRPIRLILHLRRFFCKKSTCAKKIFAERLPSLCHSHAQRTKRLQEALCHLGLRVGGQAGADVGSDLGISGSRDTILRLVRRSKTLIQSEPHIIGLDDWAYKRRLRYGTLICDLEHSQPIDLLPNRTVESVKAWLEKHPSIEIVSRDGSAEYASAITKGAPQARQVSDRWHVIKNLAACVSVQLAQSLAELRWAEQAAARLAKKEEGQALKERKTEEQETLQQLRQASPHLETAYQLVETFLHMVREHAGEQLDGWLKAVQASHLEAFQTFVTGVQQDKDAVFAGLTLPWSNGLLEGNVNRLKLSKRSMYGRAEFDLLKLRVLYRSKQSQDRKNKKKNCDFAH
jgi:transposase